MKTMILLLSLGLLQSCASLMYSRTDIDPNDKVTFNEGESVAVVVKVSKGIAAEAMQPMGKKELKSIVYASIKNEFGGKNIKVSKKAENKVVVTIVELKKGCGFCRGFFPVFGLGNSYLNAVVDVKSSKGSRKFRLDKIGQTSGMAAMGDPTLDNINYLSSNVVSTLTP